MLEWREKGKDSVKVSDATFTKKGKHIIIHYPSGDMDIRVHRDELEYIKYV